MSQTLTLIRGIPGSGKTTLATNMIRRAETRTDHFENDVFFCDANGVYRFDAAKQKFASAWCLSQTMKSLVQGRDVIVSNTFFRYAQMIPYLDIAARLGVSVKVIECTGRYQSIHSVPDETIKLMSDTFEPYIRADENGPLHE